MSMPSASKVSRKARHSTVLSLPVGRTICSSSQAVLAISVRPRLLKSLAIPWIRASSSAESGCPQKVIFVSVLGVISFSMASQRTIGEAVENVRFFHIINI